MNVVVVGGGVGGLAVSLALARAGQRVRVVEADPLPDESTPAAAFAASRPGAPQVHQTHGFLARIVRELREHAPDLLDDLLAAGCFTLPTTAALGDPQPGDEDLAVLVVRRTTFEWVIRHAALQEPGITLETASVAGLRFGAAVDGIPTVTGVEIADGGSLAADVVIAANGRRSAVPEWLATGGIEIPETVHRSGLMYVTRWYHRDPARAGELDPKLGGDLGFVKYLAVPGDGDTLSITLAIRPDDAELRRALLEPDGFDEACRRLPGPDQFFRGDALRPLGAVLPMGGLLNRRREFTTADGAPRVLGFHAVGDAHTCTNPLYGRGCSLALVQAFALAEAFAAHPDDPVARGRAYEAVSVREVVPSYEFAVQMDKLGADPAGRHLGGTGSADPMMKGLAAVFVAAATDPVLGRGVLRIWNLVASFDDLMADPQFMARAMEVMGDPDAYPPPVAIGPKRGELLASLGAPVEAAS
jgi:2-polyprenyl-6-methoxyphenol hydroxylase-like FAD-dependent oxidoreductase